MSKESLISKQASAPRICLDFSGMFLPIIVIVAANAAYEKLHAFKVGGKSQCYEISHHNKKLCDLEGETCPLK